MDNQDLNGNKKTGKVRFAGKDWDWDGHAMMSAFITAAAIIVFYFLVKNINWVGSVLQKINSTLAPFYYGILMAYLLSPVYNSTVKRCYRLGVRREGASKGKAMRTARVIGSIVSMIVLIGVMTGVIWLFLPRIFRSVVSFVNILPHRLEQLNDLIASLSTGKLGGGSKFAEIAGQTAEQLEKWIEEKVIPSMGGTMSKLSDSVIVTIRTILDFIIGIIVSVYLLNDKDRFQAKFKKLIRARFHAEQVSSIYEFGTFVNKTFGGFIIGKIIDSIIIGIICYVAMRLIRLPYPVLISSIVGVTNVIPFFGPFIGAIPSSIIICVVNPLQALYFIIMVFLLQQFDGNILGPKILGDSTGLDSFWVLFSIIMAGGLFGVPGMILGVPTFALIYYYTGKYVRKRLTAKHRPFDDASYTRLDEYGIDKAETVEIIHDQEEHDSNKKSLMSMIHKKSK